jgi:hypothetical protein
MEDTMIVEETVLVEETVVDDWDPNIPDIDVVDTISDYDVVDGDW